MEGRKMKESKEEGSREGRRKKDYIRSRKGGREGAK